MASRRQTVSTPAQRKAAIKKRAAEDAQYARAVKKQAKQQKEQEEEEMRAQAALAKRMLKTLQRIRDYDSALASGRHLTYTRSEQVRYASGGAGPVTFLPGNTYCPGCEWLVTDEQVTSGFYTDQPDDVTTRCPKCNLRFVALGTMHHDDHDMMHTFTWLCEDQTMAALATWYKADVHGTQPVVVLQELVADVPSLVWNLAKYRGANVLESLRVFIVASQ